MPIWKQHISKRGFPFHIFVANSIINQFKPLCFNQHGILSNCPLVTVTSFFKLYFAQTYFFFLSDLCLFRLFFVQMVLFCSNCFSPDMKFVQNFTPPDFQVKNLHRQFHLISTVLVRKNTKNEWKWRNLHRWQQILHSRRDWRDGQISPLI